jgi:hypothetical protein
LTCQLISNFGIVEAGVPVREIGRGDIATIMPQVKMDSDPGGSDVHTVHLARRLQIEADGMVTLAQEADPLQGPPYLHPEVQSDLDNSREIHDQLHHRLILSHRDRQFLQFHHPLFSKVSILTFHPHHHLFTICLSIRKVSNLEFGHLRLRHQYRIYTLTLRVLQ